MANIFDNVLMDEQAANGASRGWQHRLICAARQDVVYQLLPAMYSRLPERFRAIGADNGDNPPVLVSRRVNRNWVPGARRRGYSQVELIYRPMNVREWLEAHPNKGILNVRAATQMERITFFQGFPEANSPFSTGGRNSHPWSIQSSYVGNRSSSDAFHSIFGVNTKPSNTAPYTTEDQYGNPITYRRTDTAGYDENGSVLMDAKSPEVDGIRLEGADPRNGNKWEVIKGSNVVPRMHAVYEIMACVEECNQYFWPFVTRVGCYNRTSMSTLPAFPNRTGPGSFLLASAARRPWDSTRRLWECRFSLILSMEGWDQLCVSAEFQPVRMMAPVYNMDGSQAWEGSSVLRDMPTGETHEAVLIQDANFANLDMLLVNSW